MFLAETAIVLRGNASSLRSTPQELPLSDQKHRGLHAFTEVIESMFIYLDQSDWAFLHAGNARDAERVLREHGESGFASYLVSSEHIFETKKLGPGRGDRLAFLRDFPGTVLTGGITDLLLAAEGRQLLASVHGDRPAPRRVEVWRAAALSDEAFAELTSSDDWWFRLMHDFALVPLWLSRRARRGETKQTRKAGAAAQRAMLDGNVVAFTKAIGSLGPPVGAVRRFVFEALAPHAAYLAAWGRARGFVGPSRYRDPSFDRYVMSRLPVAARRNPEFVQALARVWATPTERARLAPSLAAYAAVHDSIENDLARNISPSDLVDARHAVYAPLADVFTCDRRNEAAIRKALDGSTVPTQIIRCNRLTEVAALITAAAGRVTDAGGGIS